MSEYEPITAELCGKMDTLGWYDEDGNIVFTTDSTPVSEIECLAINSKTFDRLCDAIDAVHAGLERENAELRERVAVLDKRGESMHDGWVRLPVDADGVPWRIGDVTESGQTVEAMGLNMHGWHFVGTVNEIDPAIHRHHHAPTVEDVLREFGIDWEYEDNCEDRAALLKEYAAKLRLAGDAE